MKMAMNQSRSGETSHDSGLPVITAIYTKHRYLYFKQRLKSALHRYFKTSNFCFACVCMYLSSLQKDCHQYCRNCERRSAKNLHVNRRAGYKSANVTIDASHTSCTQYWWSCIEIFKSPSVCSYLISSQQTPHCSLSIHSNRVK